MLFVRAVVESGYRLSCGSLRASTLFQNADDAREFENRGLVSRHTSTVIAGSCIDVDRFSPEPEDEGQPLVVLPARMLRDKGVEEFVSAARILRTQGVGARFALVGDTDPGNPAAVPRAQLLAWAESGDVEWWGFQTNMPAVLRKAHVVCLPSYREGSPRVLLEAACAARAAVATDVPGCRDVVVDGSTGFLVPPKDGPALAHALRIVIEDGLLRRQFGLRAKERFWREFDPKQVICRTVALYGDVACA